MGIVNSAKAPSNGKFAYTLRNSVADDSVWAIDVGFGAFPGSVVVSTNSGTAGDAGGVFTFRTQGTAYCHTLTATANLAASTGAHTGTTGTDTKLTVAAHTDNKIYIENRRGYTLGVSVTICAAENLSG